MRKSASTIRKYSALISASALLLLWQLLSGTGLVPRFMLPSPLDVITAFVKDFPLLLSNLFVTLGEAAIGLGAGILSGFLLALLMDRSVTLKAAIYPLLVLTQTVPTVAIAPLLVLWMGYGIAPKVVLILIVTFFPIATTLLEGFQSAEEEEIRLLRAMGASEMQIFRYLKWPAAMGSFFAALKIAASYSIVGAVIAEWLGGNSGLGVYMTRVKSAYSFDKMFAVIFLISALSLLLLKGIDLLKYVLMPWDRKISEAKQINPTKE